MPKRSKIIATGPPLALVAAGAVAGGVGAATQCAPGPGKEYWCMVCGEPHKQDGTKNSQGPRLVYRAANHLEYFIGTAGSELQAPSYGLAVCSG